MAEILIKHLVKRFGKVEAVSDVSLRIADGEFLVLLGPSGCGKSTILRVVAGLEDADSGEIVIGDRLVNFVDPGQAERGDGVPELRAVPAHDRVQEHRLPAPDRQEAQGRDRRGRPPRGRDPCARRAAASAFRASCRAASGSASRWRARSCASRRRS